MPRGQESAGRAFTGLALDSGTEARPGLPLEGRPPQPEEELPPTESLMRGHGALDRILLVYDHCREALEAGADFHPRELGAAAELLRTFAEDCHQKLEEEDVFPRFERAGRLKELVAALREQHAAGRRLTERILAKAQVGASKAQRDALKVELSAFNRMARPHEAREDTVLLPAFKALVPVSDWQSLGARFEEKEHRLLGRDGFDGVLRQLGELERSLRIFDLEPFTPKSVF